MKTIQGDAVECVLRWEANVGECPVWSSEEQKLYWVDILEKKIHCFNPKDQSNATYELPDIVPCMALRSAGGLVLTLKKNFAFYDPSTKRLEMLSAVESDLTNNRFNDGKCDPQGRFWAGTMDAVNWNAPAGHLFRFDSARKATLMQSEVSCSNGCGWSPDGRTMYFTESFKYAIFAYDFDPEKGSIANRRVFVTIDKAKGGFPDGMTVDEDGYVWSNIVGLGQIHRFDSKGKIERMVQLPVPRATACTFGGRDLKTLYITSSRETLKADQLKEAPLSGSLFAIQTDITGLPSTAYAG